MLDYVNLLEVVALETRLMKTKTTIRLILLPQTNNNTCKQYKK